MPKKSVRKRDTHKKRIRTPKKLRGLRIKNAMDSEEAPSSQTEGTDDGRNLSTETQNITSSSENRIPEPLFIDVSCASNLSDGSSSLCTPSQALQESLDSTDMSLNASELRSPLLSPTEEVFTLPSDCYDPGHLHSSTPVATTSSAAQTQQGVSAAVGLPMIMPASMEETHLLHEANSKLQLFLHEHWHSFVHDSGIHVMLHSRNIEKAVQRRIFFKVEGEVTLSVHCTPLDIKNYVSGDFLGVKLRSGNISEFVDNMVKVMNRIRQYEICTGVEHKEYQCGWELYPDGKIDQNPYQECRYKCTIRSQKCKLLIEPRRWRCDCCGSMVEPLRRRALSAAGEEVHPCTPEIYMTAAQLKVKSKKMSKKIQATTKQLDRLHQKMKALIENEGVNLDPETSQDLSEALQNVELTSLQSLFIQQQLKASSVKKKCGMRWHPTMIRLALSVYSASPSAYKILRKSGLVKFPHSRTLFDYSHYKPAVEGIDRDLLSAVFKRLQEHPENYKKYHVLMADEMHISRNLVYVKSTGKLIGFVNLSEVKKEITEMEMHLENESNPEPKPQCATKILTFMIKGIANDIKEVVASFPVHTLSAEDMHVHTWAVITQCERSGILINAFVSDGNAVNRSFFKMNAAVSRNRSGIVFDTVNKAAPNRILYFMSDVPHLLKTIRNCFYNSGTGPKKKRYLFKNGEPILWKTIVRLFYTYKNDNLRRSHKLNLQNVFLDSYSCMKVSYAAQVCSNTVAQDLADQKWPNTSETVKFLKKVNDWFDQLNGAHSSMGVKRNNKNLHPYTDMNDLRFNPEEENSLPGFLKYLQEWKEEAEVSNVTLNSTRNEEIIDEPEQTLQALGDDKEEQLTSAKKKQLSSQTLEGIEISVNGFMGAVRSMLFEGAKFINARVYTQDPLEQFFSKQRARGGGSVNPNVQQFLSNQRAIHLQGVIGISGRKGNTQCLDKVEISDEPLRKRPKPSKEDCP